MGFGGINPCSQTHGQLKFWSEGQSPLQTLLAGNYTPVPIFAGACANDGTLVLSGSLIKLCLWPLYSTIIFRNLLSTALSQRIGQREHS